MLTVGPRGAVLLVEWENFRALLPIGMSFEALDELRNGGGHWSRERALAGRFGVRGLEPAGMDRNLNPEMVVLSVARPMKTVCPIRKCWNR